MGKYFLDYDFGQFTSVEDEAVDWNKKLTNGDTPLMWCARKGKIDKFKLLIDCPYVNLNLKDNTGDTVAMWALKNKKYVL